MSRNDEKRFQRIIAIDYLKGIAVILVILTHALSMDQRLTIGGPFWISMAVPIFMIISGFTNTLSADRNQINSFEQYFKKEQVMPKIQRVLSPYLIVVLFELLVGQFQKYLFQQGPFVAFTLKDYFLYILTGGTTPGSYYVLILLQFIILYPFMLFAYQKSPKKSLVFYFTLHFIFDFIANYLPLPGKYYRILIFRYLAFMIVGIALYYSAPLIEKISKKFAPLSLIYIGTYAYLDYVPQVFSKWKNTALPTVFWALTLVVLGLKYLEKENNHWFSYLLSRIGQSSYYIFLIQKFLFGFGLNRFLRSINLPISLRLTISTILCCFIGLLLHRVHSNWMRKEG